MGGYKKIICIHCLEETSGYGMVWIERNTGGIVNLLQCHKQCAEERGYKIVKDIYKQRNKKE